MKNFNKYIEKAKKLNNQSAELINEQSLNSLKDTPGKLNKISFTNTGTLIMNSIIGISLTALIVFFALNSNAKSKNELFINGNINHKKIFDIDSSIYNKLNIINSNVLAFDTETRYIAEDTANMSAFFTYGYDTTNHDGIFINRKLFLNMFGNLSNGQSWKKYEGWDVKKTQNNTPVFLIWEKYNKEGTRISYENIYFGKSPYFDTKALFEVYNELENYTTKIDIEEIYLLTQKYLDLGNYKYLNKLIPMRIIKNSKKLKHVFTLFYLPTQEIEKILNINIIENINFIKFNGENKNIQDKYQVNKLLGIESNTTEVKLLNLLEQNKDRTPLKLNKSELEKINIFLEDSLYYTISSEIKKNKQKILTRKHTCNSLDKVDKKQFLVNNINAVQPIISNNHFYNDKIEQASHTNYFLDTEIYNYINNNKITLDYLIPVEVIINNNSSKEQFTKNIKKEYVALNYNKYNKKIDILWFVPNNEFLSALPKRYSDKIKKELGLIKAINTGKIDLDKVCLEYENEESILDICRTRADVLNAGNVFPNPGNHYANLEFELKEKRVISVSIYSFDGKFIMNIVNTKEFDSGFITLNLNIHELERGIYNIIFETNQNEKVLKRFIKN